MRRPGPSTPSTTTRKGFLHPRIGAGFVALVLAALTACSSAGTPTSRPTTNVTPGATPSPSPTSTADYPLTFTDDEGTQLTLDAEPQDIVSLTPATTELVFALGAGDRLRGGTDFDDYPPEAIALPDVATFTGVLMERVVDIQPDLVIAGGNNFTPAGDIERMRDLGLTVMVLYAPTVEDVLADIELVGQAIGTDDEASAITSQMRERIDEVNTAVEGFGRPRVFYEIGIEPEIYGPAPDSFVADSVELAGGDPITTTDPAVFSIPLERLIAEDPEVIVLGDAAYGVCPDAVDSRAGWQSMTAVREGEIRPVDDIIVTRPGPRLAEGLAALALAIHPTASITAPEAGAELCGGSPLPSASP